MDVLLQKFFENERWSKAIDTAFNKGIDKGELRQLTDPRVRIALLKAICNGEYEIAPPHTALIPKDNGEFRTVYINENLDRIFLSIANDLLFETCSELVHPSCKSYQTGIGTGKVVKEVVNNICKADSTKFTAFKSDLSKYFDSVPREWIHKCFDRVEEITAKSKIIDVLRKYYNNDYCFDTEGNLIEHYQSLKQGCAVASFLADALLYDMDEHMSNRNGYYVRYSDDCLYIGNDAEEALENMREHLATYGLTLNPKKVEALSSENYFKFLGFSIKGSQISLSKSRIKDFQKEIESRTIRNRETTFEKAINSVNKYLYKGDGRYSWATSVLPVITSEADINELNKFVLDALKAVKTGKKKIGGLGYEPFKEKGVITRGKGRNVKMNRTKVGTVNGYLSINAARNALLTSREVYNTLVRGL